MRNTILKNVLVNIHTLFTTNIRHNLNANSSKIARLEEIVNSMDQAITSKFHFLNLMEYYARHNEEAIQYIKELDFLRRSGAYCSFPYDISNEPINTESGFDAVAKLSFVMHKNKKLFFKAGYSPDEAVELYKYYIQVERLLDDEEKGSAPHQYQSSKIHVDRGDVLFDIGAAEGLFALDQIEKAAHVVIVESDPEWIEPLKHTFAPYDDKVTILQKFVSATDTDNTISLGKLLSIKDYNSAFIKMDIEGFEIPAIASAVELLKQRNIKMAIASYHKQHDAEELKSLLAKCGYISEFSTGYMLFHLYDTPTPPYFRKGIIRAEK